MKPKAFLLCCSLAAASFSTGCMEGPFEEWLECVGEDEAAPLVDPGVSPDFEVVIEFDLDQPDDELWEDDVGAVKIQVWDCIDLSWWTPVDPQQVIQVFLNNTECGYYETVWTEYYACYSTEGPDAPYRDYDGDGLTLAEGDCDDFDAGIQGDIDGDGLPDCIDEDGDGYTRLEGDCDDSDPAVVWVDNDLDGTSDCIDDDQDGYSELQGDPNDLDPTLCGTDEDGDGTDDCHDDDGDGLSELQGDCDDTDPDTATLDNDLDGTNDCSDDDGDGLTELQGDCDDADPTIGGTDNDGDGTSDCSDDDGDGLTELQGDCDDSNPAVGSLDNDLDGTNDCSDDDGDGLTELQGDCDDSDPTIGAIDGDGDGTSDCTDDDGDGISESAGDCDDTDPGVAGMDQDQDGTNDCLDDDGDGLTERQGDCDDQDPAIAGMDQDQDGTNDCLDDDGDGASERDGDCNDLSAQVYPGASDGCDGTDNDCDGAVDEDPDIEAYPDADADGYGDQAAAPEFTCSPPPGYATNRLDCDDADAGISPATAEVPDNGIDENCDGLDFPVQAAVTVDGEPLFAGVPTFSRIQDAIDAASGGDTVVVGPGTYYEKIDFAGKNLYLVSTNGPDDTIIDAGGLEDDPAGHDSVFLFTNGEGLDSPAVVKGFTITGGRGTEGGTCGYALGELTGLRYGGAICTRGASPRIEGNIIELNEVSGSGGALYLDLAPAAVVDNIIRWNSAAYDAAGINLSQSSGEISGNLIAENHAGRDGAGIYAFDSGPVIVDNVIVYNRSEDLDDVPVVPGKGAGICLYEAYAVIRNNVIAYNDAADKDGGGIWIANTASGGELTNNTLAGNHAVGEGGAIRMVSGSMDMTNNILAFNTAASGANVMVTSPGFLTSQYNLFFLPSGSDGLTGLSTTEHDLNQDPLFVDDPTDDIPEDDDYHLAQGSPAIDSGHPDAGYDDPDDTRNDRGAFGGPLALDLPFSDMAQVASALED